MTCDKFAVPSPVLEIPGSLGVAGCPVPAGSMTSPASKTVRSSYKPYLRTALVERYSMNLTLLRYHVDVSHCQYG